MSTILKEVEEVHNWASDTNFVWFPFLFLKPSAETLIEQKRILLMAPCFGLYFNVAYFLKRLAFGDDLSWSVMLTAQVYWTLGFYVWFNVVTAYFWNRRARRLQKKPAPKELAG